MSDLQRIAELLEKRNQIDLEISKIIGRPATVGHIGEFIASKIFKIKIENSAITKGIDGIFTEGPLKGKTVNIKLYGKQEGIVDITISELADYYLVITGPKTAPTTSRGSSRPLVIAYVYLFEMCELIKELQKRGVKIGVATSVAQSYWEATEIYPHNANSKLKLTKEQIGLLDLFSIGSVRS